MTDRLCNRMTGCLLLFSGICLTAGCGASVSPEIATARQTYLSEQPPTGETAIGTIREQLKNGELQPDSQIVIRARINAGEMPPWGTGTASFVVTDAMGHDGDEEHDPHTCPFCSRNIEESMAQVHFEDAAGHLLKTDSRELFDLKQNQLVVVRGTGHLDESNSLIIRAQQMFVQR